MLAKDMAEYDNIYVVDSLQASLSERLLVEYAVKLRDAGMGAKELVRKLEQDRERVILTGVPSTYFSGCGGSRWRDRDQTGALAEGRRDRKPQQGKRYAYGEVRHAELLKGL